MDVVRPSPNHLRFEAFEVDLVAGQLRHHGKRIKLQEHPFQVLALLLERPGQVVSRDELQARLWAKDTFVDFEHGVNKAISKLREALGDSADSPRFIETLPRRGYRFIAPVQVIEPARQTVAARSRWWRRRALALVTLPVAIAVLLVLNHTGLREQLFGRSAPGKIKSIAVLPMKNLSSDPEQAYLAQGLTDAIITELGQVGSLRVISFQSVMQYKQTERSLPQIAAELNVDVIVEGTALREGHRVRVTAQLVQVKPERHLWAHSYERDLGSILSLQSEMAREIAQQIKVTVTPEEGERLARIHSVKPEAHDAYLRGRYFWNQRSEEGFKKGLEYFQEAIRKDPNYALAYAGVADSYLLLCNYDALPPQEAFPKARTAAMKALELDDTSAEAHASLAYVYENVDWDWAGAEQEYKRAIELNPGYATAHHWYSGILLSSGRLKEALAEAKRAHELDPLSFPVNDNLAGLLAWSGEYEEAIGILRKSNEMDPRRVSQHYLLGWVYVQKRMYKEAIEEMQRAHDLASDKGVYIAGLGYTYALSGQREKALEMLDQLEELSKTKFVSATDRATIYVGLGDKDQAFKWLEKAYRMHEPGVTLLGLSPLYDPLRDDPRYHSLLRRMNLPE